MMARCYNPKCDMYHRYGARGIVVCVRWLTGFSAFYDDMGDRPSSKHSLDRIDVNGPYSKDNCRWATRREQARNKSNTVRITWQGETRTTFDWEAATGIPAK